LLNVIRPVRIVAPQMVKQKGGAIINISTAWAFEPSAMFPTSAVFRAGLAAFTKIFTDTHAADNIRMNNVLPGWIDSLPQLDARRDSVPMRRYGKARRSPRRSRSWRPTARPISRDRTSASTAD
jgi:NAD(P)-dependent dehydrogenase (short-subunit alcohol dehydrogenase family)